METIKVNMNPNPLDVQTIHASQNDGEARQWGFELHNNGDVIDSSEVTVTARSYSKNSNVMHVTLGVVRNTLTAKLNLRKVKQ